MSIVRDFNEWIEEQALDEALYGLLDQMDDEDEDVIREIEKFMEKAVKKTKNDFKKAASKWGVK